MAGTRPLSSAGGSHSALWLPLGDRQCSRGQRRPYAPAVAIQWHRLFDQALRQADVVPVVKVATTYLGREPTRSELVAVRRAANSYARHSNTQVLHVHTPTRNRGPRLTLLLARADADLTNQERLEGIAAGQPPRIRRGTNGPQRTENLVGAVAKAAHSADNIDVDQIDPDHAHQLAADLTLAMTALRRLTRRLQRR